MFIEYLMKQITVPTGRSGQAAETIAIRKADGFANRNLDSTILKVPLANKESMSPAGPFLKGLFVP
jgi:hypothetical protein